MSEAVDCFVRGGVCDSAGDEHEAVPLYRRALELGLDPDRRRQCTIQLASTLRNVGELEEALALLEAELQAPSDAYDGAVRVFYALVLTSAGREREAVAAALEAALPALPRYRRSVQAYADALRAG